MIRRLFFPTPFLAFARAASAAHHETEGCSYGGTSAGVVEAVQVAKISLRLLRDGQVLTAAAP